jgi:hypothetical protein
VVVVNKSVRLSVNTITKLTDAASELFRLLYKLEQVQQAAVKERLRRTLAETDVFRNSTLHEEPDEWRGK